MFVPAGKPVEATGDSTGILAGVRYLRRNRLLLAWTVTMAIGDGAWNALFATLPYYAYTRYDGNAKVAGILPACFGVAAVAGNVASLSRPPQNGARDTDRRFRPRPGRAALAAVGAGPAGWIASARAPGRSCQRDREPVAARLPHLIVPPAVRSQALTAVLAINQLAAPVGFLGAGLILAHAGYGPIFVLVPAVQTLTMGARALATLRRRESLPVTAS